MITFTHIPNNGFVGAIERPIEGVMCGGVDVIVIPQPGNDKRKRAHQAEVPL